MGRRPPWPRATPVRWVCSCGHATWLPGPDRERPASTRRHSRRVASTSVAGLHPGVAV
ncbi:hypothetical protein ACFFX0_12985 [Citricoccus parietis]|uniref:Uncharacterized protein n=1 Tax=Citricoccus parietis TaxID=592307 RepID=A0ABV5FZJ3_9MICC